MTEQASKNSSDVSCQFCKSLILKSQMANFIELSIDLPLMKQKARTGEIPAQVETEMLTDFWFVDDMFTFENMGFSHTVENKKYLVCADCEMGPIGYYDILSKKGYIALSRVKFE